MSSPEWRTRRWLWGFSHPEARWPDRLLDRVYDLKHPLRARRARRL